MTRRRTLLGTALMAALPAWLPIAAQAQTVIVADTAPDRNLGTIVNRDGTRTTIDGGRLAGRNLFHSLATFRLNAGDTAAWTFSFANPALIQNVITRVTGGELSTINGTIDSAALPNADFWFINPAGIVLGENAQLNVAAGAHFAAASHLDFFRGGRFSAVTPGGSTFSMTVPESFGFQGTEGALAVFGSPASRPIAAPGAITLAGRDLSISDRALVVGERFSRGSGFRLIAAGNSPVVLPINPNSTDPMIATGRLTVSNATITSAREDVEIDAGSIVMSRTAISVDALFEPTLVMFATDSITLTDSLINTSASGDRGAGAIIFTARNALILDRTTLFSNQSGTGLQGFIAMEGSDVRIRDSRISALSTGLGDAGNIFVDGRTIVVDGASVIETNGLSRGVAGFVQFRAAESIRLAGNAAITSNNSSGGRRAFAGLIRFEAPDIRLSGNASITANSLGSGSPGDIGIAARDFRMDGGRIELTAAGTGDAGTLQITADTISLANGALISSDTTSLGQAGSITIRAAQGLAMERGVTVTSSTTGAGNAGSISISASELRLDNSAIATAVAPAARGGAGNITITTSGDIVLANGSRIASSNDGLATDAASAGTITVGARNLTLANGAQITTNSAFGPAGAIRLDLPSGGLLRLSDGAFGPSIVTTSSGPGTGGVITIGNPLAIISQGGNIFALGEQAGANVVIRSQFYIDAADRLDQIRVNGNFVFQGQLDYVASGEEPRDIDLLDASAVLAGRCRAARAGGGASQLSIAAIGPYGLAEPEAAPGERPAGPVALLDRAAPDRPCG
jgi:filamentous hemagglutinin family protein